LLKDNDKIGGQVDVALLYSVGYKFVTV